MTGSTQILAISAAALAIIVALVFAYQVHPEWFPLLAEIGPPP